MSIDVSDARAARFWTHVDRSDTGGCWTWLRAKTHNGYGVFVVAKGVFGRAHRYSWVLHNGAIPDGLMVLHRCDNRACVRPDHLVLGTARDNTRDMIAKERDVPPPLNSGERMWKARLSADDVRTIKALRREGIGPTAVARRFGVSKQAITSINAGRCWRHIA